MEELNPAHLAALQQQLHALKGQLQAQLDESADGSRPVALDQPIGRLSRMEALQQQAMAVANRDSLQQRLTRVEAALQAVAGGTYGLCRFCEEPITYSRLAAYPETPLCLDCQRRSEGRP